MTIIVVCLLLHRGGVGQAREDIKAAKMFLDEKIHAIAAGSAVHGIEFNPSKRVDNDKQLLRHDHLAVDVLNFDE